MPDPIETVQKEFERWRGRERLLQEALSQVEEESRRLTEELAKVEQQIVYYESLTRDMKRELGPSGLSSLLSSFRKS
ncbi:MAG: hypothetical protein WC985_00360 [Thermoplasmata archaeon]